MPNLNITNIPAPRVPFIDERTGLMAREWYRFFLNLFVLTGSGNNPITLEELQLGPPNQPDLAELLIQINQNIAPQYEDQSGDFLATLDTAQLMSMMSQFANAEAAIQGAYLQPVVQTGTIANYNLDGSPTAGGIAYGTGPALAVSAAGTLGQVLTSAGAGTPTWAAPTTGTVSSVSVVSANGLAGTVATATTTPAITLSTTITGLLKGNGTAISAATSGTDYAPATSGTSILYGNGAGGFSNVTIGSGVAFAGGTLSATGSGGTVTSVTGTAPVVSSGGATPAISMAAATTSVNGYLTSTDWTTFNNKQAALVSGTNIKTVNGTTLLGSGDLGTITYAYGGTGQTTVTTGDLLYGSASNVWSKLGIGTTGQILRVVSGAPAWGTDYVGTVTSVGGTGTVNGLTLTGTVTSSGNLTLGGTLDLSSPPAIGGTSAASGKFTTLSASDTITPSQTKGIVGTTTTNDAQAGSVGESVMSSSALTNYPATGTWGDLTSISLTAGDWDIAAVTQQTTPGTMTGETRLGISVTSGNSATGLTIGYNRLTFPNATVAADSGASIPMYRLQLGSTTTVYLKFFTEYSTGTPKALGTIIARRRR